MKISNSIPALWFLTGIICLLFSSCNDEESERGTLVPLRLSMTIPAAEGSVTTRAEQIAAFKMALATGTNFATGAKDYQSVGTDGALTYTLSPQTANDELKISRLATSTPLTLYGTLKHPTLGIQPLFYTAGSTPCNEGAIKIQPQLGNAIIVVNSGNGKTYNVNIKNLKVPSVTNGLYEWDTSGSTPKLKASNTAPATFKTSTITTTNALAPGNYASIAPIAVGPNVGIMTITETNGSDTYTVTAPTAINFAANNCYFITLNVNEEKEVSMTMTITPMTTETIEFNSDPGIYSKQDLIDFRNEWNAYGEVGIENGAYDKWVVYRKNIVNLYANIDLKSEEWTPIGNSSNTFRNLVFDGNGHTISNLTVTQSNNGGFFEILSNATVKNLTIETAKINTSSTSGVIASSVEQNGIISNCHVKKATVAINGDAAGIAGALTEGCKIEGCSVSESSIKGDYAGGIAIVSYKPCNISACTVSNCDIEGSSASAGIASTNFFTQAVVTACTASDLRLKSGSSSNIHAIGNEVTITGCYYAKLSDASNSNAEIGSLNDGSYLVTEADLKSKYINGQLNNSLKTAGISDFCFEAGELKKEAPQTTSWENYIYTATHLVDLSNKVNNNQDISQYISGSWIYIEEDIDMTDVEFTPIGTSYNCLTSPINGNFHKISNLSGCPSLIGGFTGYNIVNLILVNPSFVGDLNCGMIGTLGQMDATLTNCQILNGSINGDQYAGGLIGYNNGQLTIESCLVSGVSIQTGSYSETAAGGFIGYQTENSSSYINYSAVRNVSIDAQYAGGFIGHNKVERNFHFIGDIVQNISWGWGRADTPGFIAGRTKIPLSVDPIMEYVYYNNVNTEYAGTEAGAGSNQLLMLGSKNAIMTETEIKQNSNLSTFYGWQWDATKNLAVQRGWEPGY